MTAQDKLHQHVARIRLLDPTEWEEIIAHYAAQIHPEGQWRYPGQCTMIPTTNGHITMHGVTVPVFATDETGYSVYMLPNRNYIFPGKMIFEIPQTQQYEPLIQQLCKTI